ncbi:effector binding domain-containing protein [Empedobacter brevis]|uniref:Effector binding domain-containing protein n=1 Tax=Empedobacter brevis TaxID=247 RepID=A0AAJ1V6V0_9FLAO|nr:GyrI-like domain-containing protein [Empedobacter brevis]MDM1071961.1 effector binding domain-containing protein [Empedobacter brevis]
MNTLKIIGITTQTSNNDGQAIKDLGELWRQFFDENLIAKIPNAISSNIYAVYTDYESDFTGKYTTIIGLEVASLDEIPEGMVGREFQPQTFKKYIAKGELHEAVGKTWTEIWNDDKNLNRTYNYDYELYTDKAQNPMDAEIEIYIGVKDL